MLNKSLLVILLSFAVITVIASNQAMAFVIDGSLADWGVTPAAFGSSDWIPYAGIFYTVEDYEPGTAGGFVGPGNGGQPIDAEAMYMAISGSNLYFAIVTGFPPEGIDDIRPGDVAFDFGADGSYEYGIKVVDYSGTAGTLYSVTEWEPGPDDWGYGNIGHVSYPTEMKTYTEIYDPVVQNLVYNNTYYSAFDHYVIEGYMPYAYFGSDWGKTLTMHWTETCGNDAINVTTPEPTTFSLLSIGLLGLARLKRKNRRKS